MPALTSLYVDFLSVHCYRAWLWLSQLEESGAVQIRPYLADGDSAQEQGPWDRRTPSLSLELLALGELARDEGPETHRAYVAAAFAAAHRRRGELRGAEAWLALATEAGLNLGAFAKEGERWRAEVGLWHVEAQDELGVRGVPSLVFDDSLAILVSLGTTVEGPAAARRLLGAVTELVAADVREVRSARGAK